MQVYVDGAKVDEDFGDGGTLEDTIRKVQETQCAPDQLVIGLSCDGQEVPGPQIPATLKMPADDFDRLDVVTSTKGRLVGEAMDQASDTLNEAEEALQEIASLLIEGRTAEALAGLGDCARVWQQIHESIIRSIELLQIDPEKMRVREGTLTDAMLQPRSVLQQIRDALQAQDHVLLADVLQYEFAEAMEDWHAVIAGIRASAKS